MKNVNDIVSAIDTSIYNKSHGILDIKTSLLILFAIYGIRKIRTNPVMPNGVNLLWWAYNMLGKGEK